MLSEEEIINREPYFSQEHTQDQQSQEGLRKADFLFDKEVIQSYIKYFFNSGEKNYIENKR